MRCFIWLTFQCDIHAIFFFFSLPLFASQCLSAITLWVGGECVYTCRYVYFMSQLLKIECENRMWITNTFVICIHTHTHTYTSSSKLNDLAVCRKWNIKNEYQINVNWLHSRYGHLCNILKYSRKTDNNKREKYI